MIKQLLDRILAPRHYWRHMSFSELSEMYVAGMLRMLGLSLVGIFMPIYLIKNGYSVTDVFLFFTIFYAAGYLGLNDAVGRLIGRFGPKHIMRASFPLHVLYLLMLSVVPAFHWPIWLLAIIFRAATVSYFLPYHVDFSKIEHKDHGGKEIGTLTILERFGGIVGPVAGGLVATYFGGQYIMVVAAAVLLLATIPLMMSAEPVKTHQHVTYKGLDLKKMPRTLFIHSMRAVEASVNNWMWPFFVGVFIFSTHAYINLGIVTSLGALAAILTAYTVGKLVDKKQGRELLNYGLTANAAVWLLRFLVNNFSTVLLINMINEPVTTAYHMPYIKGYYDQADDLPGYRIAYFMLTENIMDVVRSLVWLSFTIASAVWINQQINVFYGGFVLAAIASLLIMFQKYPALAKTN